LTRRHGRGKDCHDGGERGKEKTQHTRRKVTDDFYPKGGGSVSSTLWRKKRCPIKKEDERLFHPPFQRRGEKRGKPSHSFLLLSAERR